MNPTSRIRTSRLLSPVRRNCQGEDQEAYLIDYRRSAISGRLRVAQMPRVMEEDSKYYEELSGAIVLLIGSQQDCIHSVYRPDTVLTNGCWDVFGVLPALIPPDGVIGIYGLGAGTIPRLIHHYYPQQKMIGWELDPDIVDLARQHMGLNFLEQTGCLEVVIGDCFSESTTLPGSLSGLIVDVYVDTSVHPALSQIDTWKRLRSLLRPGGRLIANLEPESLHKMSIAFDGDVQFHVHKVSHNLIALSGPFPDQWSSLPSDLTSQGCGLGWKRYDVADLRSDRS